MHSRKPQEEVRYSELDELYIPSQFDIADTLRRLPLHAATRGDAAFPVSDTGTVVSDQLLLGEDWLQGQGQIHRGDVYGPALWIDCTALRTFPLPMGLHLYIIAA